MFRMGDLFGLGKRLFRKFVRKWKFSGPIFFNYRDSRKKIEGLEELITDVYGVISHRILTPNTDKTTPSTDLERPLGFSYLSRVN